jgi:hypothetical protein
MLKREIAATTQKILVTPKTSEAHSGSDRFTVAATNVERSILNQATQFYQDDSR